MMSSKHAQSRVNSLFLDTRVFNTSSKEYISDLNKPGALERLNSTSFEDPESIMNIHSKRNASELSFGKIRDSNRVTQDVSQMAVAQLNPSPMTHRTSQPEGSTSSFNFNKLTFNREAKACVPGYSIKNHSLQRVKPFFSPEKAMA